MYFSNMCDLVANHNVTWNISICKWYKHAKLQSYQMTEELKTCFLVICSWHWELKNTMEKCNPIFTTPIQ